jgi:hypothetical protein
MAGHEIAQQTLNSQFFGPVFISEFPATDRGKTKQQGKKLIIHRNSAFPWRLEVY